MLNIQKEKIQRCNANKGVQFVDADHTNPGDTFERGSGGLLFGSVLSLKRGVPRDLVGTMTVRRFQDSDLLSFLQ
jgi:hypothetical protein